MQKKIYGGTNNANMDCSAPMHTTRSAFLDKELCSRPTLQPNKLAPGEVDEKELNSLTSKSMVTFFCESAVFFVDNRTCQFQSLECVMMILSDIDDGRQS